MPSHCVVPSRPTAITRTVTVAAGRFAPGHLGELRSIVPFALVDAVLSETRTVQRRLRDLPSQVGVYFLLAMCLFPEIGYRLVWDKLTVGLSGMPIVCPSAKALCDLRRRLDSGPSTTPHHLNRNGEVNGLNRVRGADDAADLGVEAEERRELLPRVLPEPHDRRVLLAPGIGELGEPLEGSLFGRGGVGRGPSP